MGDGITANNLKLSKVQSSIIQTLSYFDIFKYPLSIKEINYFLNLKDKQTSEKDLNELVQSKLIKSIEKGYYGINTESHHLQLRFDANKRAQLAMARAKRISRLIAHFPFVRAVMLSGSISKGVMSLDSDIDFFVITSKNRLWIARMALVIFKRIFLLNSFKNFCINYYVDADHLKIDEENIYTAIELATLIPTYGSQYYLMLMEANNWIDFYLPNVQIKLTKNVPPFSNNILKRTIEVVLKNNLGNRLEHLCRTLTLRRWENKYYQKYDNNDFKVAFKTTEGVSKNHPKFYQKQVLSKLESIISSLEKKHNICINGYNEK